MTVKAGLLNDRVIHDDGCIGEVISAPGFITTGSSVVFINGEPMAIHGSRVSCAGYVEASAKVVYSE
jgi:uncharacterized Zn-binding protein involved in type VI secretion